MNKYLIFIITIICILTLSLIALKDKADKDTNFYATSGVIKSNSIQIASIVPGLLDKIYYKNGDKVNKGDKIVEIGFVKLQSDSVTPTEENVLIHDTYFISNNTLTIYASNTGIIGDFNLVQGSFIKSNDVLFSIIPDSSKYVQVQMDDVPVRSTVKVGEPIIMDLNNTGAYLKGSIDYIQPYLSEGKEIISIQFNKNYSEIENALVNSPLTVYFPKDQNIISIMGFKLNFLYDKNKLDFSSN